MYKDGKQKRNTGDFLIKKNLRISRQKVIDNCLLAIKLGKEGKEFNFWIDGYNVTTTVKDLWETGIYTNAFAIIEMNHGFTLGYVLTKNRPYAIAYSTPKNKDLDSPRISIDMNYKNQIRIWCRKVSIYQTGLNWEFKNNLEKLNNFF